MWLGKKGGSVSSELTFLLFYAAFYIFVIFIASIGAPTGGLNHTFNPPPSLGTSAPGILDYLSFVFNYIVYFFTLQGLTIAGLDAAYAVLISIPFTIAFVYVIVRLIRGGG